MSGLSVLATMTIVLVHGGFVDGSGWQPVYNILTRSGHKVYVVQNSTVSLADDVAATLRIVDDHPLMREGIAALIAKEADLALVAEASSGLEGIQQFREHRPDVTLLDIRLPDISGIDALIAIRNEDSSARVIMFTTSQGDVEIQRALRAGARGYMLKSTPPRELLDAIRDVHRGLTRIPAEVATHLAENLAAAALTPRELEVLSSMASGNRNREIAATLGIAEMTVKIHVRHVMEKLGARDRTEAVAIGLRRGIIHL